MPPILNAAAAAALRVVRRAPGLHRAVHAAALRLERTAWGERFIRGVLDEGAGETIGYAAWVERYDTLREVDRRGIAAHIARFERTPLISVVMPVYAVAPDLLEAAIASVQGQLYPHWELCIADDASPGEAVWTTLQRLAASDPRIKAVRRPTNGNICAATNSALTLATGEFVALMDHDDLLSPRALYEVAALIQDHPDADLIYSDEDKIDAAGQRYEPHFKTGWNPELLLAQNMVSHLGVYRRALIEAGGGLREGFEGSQDYDLALRIAEATTPARIHHIPWPLYHWRQSGGPETFSQAQMDRCAAAAQRAVAEHLARTGQPVSSVARMDDTPGWVTVRRAIPEPRPMVSVIVPTRDRADLLAACVEGVLKSGYGPLELLVVDNGSVEPETLALFARLSGESRVRVLNAPGPFNFSALNNRAAAEARGEILLLLNNDISMPAPGWLEALVAQAVRPSVGAVGARLLYPDGRVQHAGVALGLGGVAGHVGHFAPGETAGYFGHLKSARNVSAVTAACLALRKTVFDQVGGLDSENLAVAFNDIDLCLRIRAAGYDIIFEPACELIHHESASRGTDTEGPAHDRFRAEIAHMRARWGKTLDHDPYYGPIFSLRHSDYQLARPPRRAPPWTLPPPADRSR
jgi:glycosyltransferase involved in cell wall biosynthesis